MYMDIANCPPGPLHGIRVVDLTTVMFGPYAGRPAYDDLIQGMAGVSVKFTKTPGGLQRHAERLGGSSVEVLHELGYSATQIAELEKSGVTRT